MNGHRLLGSFTCKEVGLNLWSRTCPSMFKHPYPPALSPFSWASLHTPTCPGVGCVTCIWFLNLSGPRSPWERE